MATSQPTASSVSGEQPQRTLPFWVAIFFGWIVWALAVGAAAGKNWLKLSDIRVGGPEYFNEACDAGVIADTWCATCESVVFPRDTHMTQSDRETFFTPIPRHVGLEGFKLASLH